MIVDPSHAPTAHATPSPHLTNKPADDMKRVPMTMREWWARTWPSLLAVVTLTAVGGPAAVASYRHARDVITQHGDPVMAPWLALTTDGMLLAALTVIWVRRHRSEPVKAGPWAAFWAGMTVTIAANLAAAHPTPIGIVVALWPPICLAITLELVALVAYPAQQHPNVTGARRGEWTGHVPDHPPTAPGHAPAEPAAKTISSPAGQPTVPEHTRLASGTEPGHQASQNGHSHHAPTAGAPDDHILAWLREQERTTGRVPGRRHVIEQWALGSTRADRLRAIIIKESASTAPTPAG